MKINKHKYTLYVNLYNCTCTIVTTCRQAAIATARYYFGLVPHDTITIINIE